jgi:hypothetical protein
VNKGGSGVRPRVGFGTKREIIHVIRNFADLEKIKGSAMIASALGAKKTAEIAKRAGELGITILNKRKLKRYEKIMRKLGKKEIKKTEMKKESKEIKEVKTEVREEKASAEEKKEEK